MKILALNIGDSLDEKQKTMENLKSINNESENQNISESELRKTKNRKWSIIQLMKIRPLDSSSIFYAFIILRFIATCLITNTHYNNVYPIEELAVGGLLGDVLFFIVSGFVLAKPTDEKFYKWYGKRIIRIYPAILIMIVISLCIGHFTLEVKNFFDIIQMFIFPTAFVFVGAIMLLYIVLFFCNKIKNKKSFIAVILSVLVAYIIVYMAFLDKSVYQMNDVNNPIILFLYGISMLLGCYIRKFISFKKENKIRRYILYIFAVSFCIIYFLSNNIIRQNNNLLFFQILVPISLILASTLLTLSFYDTENVFKKIPTSIMKVINFIAALTLEIYVVQRPIINALEEIIFPVNWIIITWLIVIAALALRIFVNIIIQGIEFCLRKRKEEET